MYCTYVARPSSAPVPFGFVFYWCKLHVLHGVQAMSNCVSVLMLPTCFVGLLVSEWGRGYCGAGDKEPECR